MVTINKVTHNDSPFIVAEHEGTVWVSDILANHVTCTTENRKQNLLNRMALVNNAYRQSSRYLGTVEEATRYLRFQLWANGECNTWTLLSADHTTGNKIAVVSSVGLVEANRLPGGKWCCDWSPGTFLAHEAAEQVASTEANTPLYAPVIAAALEVEGIFKALHLPAPLRSTYGKGTYVGASFPEVNLLLSPADQVALDIVQVHLQDGGRQEATINDAAAICAEQIITERLNKTGRN